jgi:hypothetical protein
MSLINMDEVTELYWVSRNRDILAPILSQLYPNLKQYSAFDFSTTHATGFFHPDQCPERQCPPDVTEWGPYRFEKMVVTHWHLCPLLTHHLIDLTIELPDKFFVLQPYSPSSNIPGRDFDSRDWRGCIKILEDRQIKGIVLDTGYRDVPEHPLVLNLQRKTPDLRTTIEIVKRGSGFIGCDSCLGILVAQTAKKEDLYIKAVNTWLPNVQHVYYPAHTDFSFIKSSI